MLYIEVIPAYCENKQNMWNTLWTKQRFLIIEQVIHVLCLNEIEERGFFEVHMVMGLTFHWSTVQSIDMLVVHLLLFKNGRPIRFCLLGSIGLHDGSVILLVFTH